VRIGIVYHDDFTKYDFGPGHPLRGYYLDGDIAFSLIKSNKELGERAEMVFVQPTPGQEDDILTVHTREYLDFIKGLNDEGGHITLDTPVNKGTYDVARLFVGADIVAANTLMDETFNKTFVLDMMGHHAGMDFGGGFCLINDVAIMIELLRRKYGLKRILAFDYAVNTGHGTMSIFYDTPEVLCIDIHQDPLTLYPGTGFPEQVGRGEGQGYTVNIPLPPFTSDKDYLLALNEIVIPIVNEYQPEVIVMAGLNGGHFTVKINQFIQTLKGLWEIVNIFSKLSDNLCDGKLLHIGGFSVDSRLLPLGFLATIAGALDVKVDLPEPYKMPSNFPDVTSEVVDAIQRVKKVHKRYWKWL